MPTYEYACKSCGQHLEVVQSLKDDALTECPNCSGQLRKVFGNIGISFKGSGFYKNDSRSSGSKTSSTAASSDSPAKSESSSTSDSAGSSSTSPTPKESKPASSPAPSSGSTAAAS